jgi:hypothetical protein
MHQHQRQFMISPTPLKAYRDWESETVQGVGFLSHCPTLPVQKVISHDGREYVLIGIAVQTDPSRPQPIEELKKPTSCIADLTDTWTGRWALIANGILLTDTAGILGCLYSDTEGGLLVSSSAALLRTSQTATFDNRLLDFGAGFEWYVAPLSRYVGVRRLLPSQELDLKTGKVRAKRLFRAEELTYEQALVQIEQTLVTALTALARTSQSLWLPLTAGFDSRLILAAVVRAGVKVRCYTSWYTDMTLADLTLPPKLAEAAGFEHVLIKPGEHDGVKESIFAAHTADGWADRDKDYICRGQWDQFVETDIILRGAGMEVGCHRTSRSHFTAPKANPWKVPPAEWILNEYGQYSTAPLVHALQEWRAWTEATPHPEIDWRDRFYIEQRLGAWASSNEQAVDLVPCNRVFLASCGRYMSSVFQIPEHIRHDSAHQVELIRRMAPDLLAYPFNARDPLFRRIPKTMRHRRRRLWQAISQKQLGRTLISFCQKRLRHLLIAQSPRQA